MSTKTDYSVAEWKAISGAPVAAGLFLTLADASGPVGVATEAMAVAKAIARSAVGDAPEIVKALADSVKAGGGRPELPDVRTSDRTQTKKALIGAVRTAVQAVENKSPSEVEGYKTWLAAVAARACQASKEAGFPDTAGTRVSREEERALEQLADVLARSTATTGHGIGAHPMRCKRYPWSRPTSTYRRA